MDHAAVCAGFGLGSLVDVHAVAGGLSNDMWHVWTERGEFAIKAMVVNAERADFVANLEAAFTVERRAFAAAVPMPEPIAVPGTGRCLLAVDGRLTRAHCWVDATPVIPRQHAWLAGAMLARIHAAAVAGVSALDDEPWTPTQWRELAEQRVASPALAVAIGAAAEALAQLEAITTQAAAAVVTVDSHRDLDPKNVLVGRAGLLAVDWDAAGPVPAAREAVQVALDWTSEPRGFGEVIAAYRRKSPHEVPAEAWVFGAWVSACARWLVYNATARSGTPLGDRESATALDRLQHLSANLSDYLQILR